MKPGDLEKTAFHLEAKEKVTLASYVEKMGRHGANHLQQIERIEETGGQGRITPLGLCEGDYRLKLFLAAPESIA